jgi:AraC-like DNA-binding protein
MVKSIIDFHKIKYLKIDIGYIDLAEGISILNMRKLNSDLKMVGLEILDHNDSILIEKVKQIIIEMVHYSDELPKLTFSIYLSEKMQYDYNYVSNLFSKLTGITIQHYILEQKIERVKEMILYDQYSFAEIAQILNYSSPAHLSVQFKKMTGFTCSSFKKLSNEKKKNI